MNTKKVITVILVAMFISIFACYDDEGRKHNEFLAANKQHINNIYEKMKTAREGDLIEMRNSELWVVSNLTNFLKRGVTLKKTNYESGEERIDRFISNKELCYNIVRIIKPEDADYPEKAKQFLLEK